MSQRRFVDPFGLIFPNMFLKDHSILLNVNLEVKFIILWKSTLDLMSDLVVFLEFRHQIIDLDMILPDIIIFIVLPLHHSKYKILFSSFEIILDLEIQPAWTDSDDWSTSYFLEGCFDWYFIFVKFLCTYISCSVYLCSQQIDM